MVARRDQRISLKLVLNEKLERGDGFVYKYGKQFERWKRKRLTKKSFSFQFVKERIRRAGYEYILF